MHMNDIDDIASYKRSVKDGVDFPNIAILLNSRQLGLKQKLVRNFTKFAEHKAVYSCLDKTKCELPPSARSTFLMAFSHDLSKVASTHGDHKIYISDAKTGKALQALEGHPRTPWCIKFHPTSSDILASGCLGGEVRIWDLQGGSEKWKVKPDQVISSITFHPFQHLVVIATGNCLYFWDWHMSEPEARCSTTSELEKVRYVEFDRYGHRLITGISNMNASTSGRSLHAANRNHSVGVTSQRIRPLDSLMNDFAIFYDQNPPRRPRDPPAPPSSLRLLRTFTPSFLSDARDAYNILQLWNAQHTNQDNGSETNDNERDVNNQLSRVTDEHSYNSGHYADSDAETASTSNAYAGAASTSNADAGVASTSSADARTELINVDTSSELSINVDADTDNDSQPDSETVQDSQVDIEPEVIPDPVIETNIAADFFTTGQFLNTFGRMINICSDMENYLIGNPNTNRSEPLPGPSVNNSENDLADLSLVRTSGYLTQAYANPYADIVKMLYRTRHSLCCSTITRCVVHERLIYLQDRILEINDRLRYWTVWRIVGFSQRQTFDDMTYQLTEQLGRLIDATRFVTTMSISHQRSPQGIGQPAVSQPSSSQSNERSNLRNSSPEPVPPTSQMPNGPRSAVLNEIRPITRSTLPVGPIRTFRGYHCHSLIQAQNQRRRRRRRARRRRRQRRTRRRQRQRLNANSTEGHLARNRDTPPAESAQQVAPDQNDQPVRRPRVIGQNHNPTPITVTYQDIVDFQRFEMDPNPEQERPARRFNIRDEPEIARIARGARPVSDSDSDRPTTPPLLMYSDAPTITAQIALNESLCRTQRIQCWNFSKHQLPAIHDARANIVVKKCVIHNDASVDISQDGEKLICLIPPDDRLGVNTRIGLFSLKSKNLGHNYILWGFVPNAISISLSPYSDFFVVGSSYARPVVTHIYFPAIAHVVKLNQRGETCEPHYIRCYRQRSIDHQHVSLNCVRFLPQSGAGLAYATNKGDLCICTTQYSVPDEELRIYAGRPPVDPSAI